MNYVTLKLVLKVLKILLSYHAIKMLFTASRRRGKGQPHEMGQLILRTPKEMPLVGCAMMALFWLQFLVRYMEVMEKGKAEEPILALGLLMVTATLATILGALYWSKRRIFVSPGFLQLKGPFGVEKQILFSSIQEVTYSRWLKSIHIRAGNSPLRVDIFLEGFFDFVQVLRANVPSEKLKLSDYEKLIGYQTA